MWTLYAFDDIILPASDEVEHNRIIREVFETARKEKIRFDQNKIQFKVKIAKCMGNIITDQGLRFNPRKVRAITEIDEPKSTKRYADV